MKANIYDVSELKCRTCGKDVILYFGGAVNLKYVRCYTPLVALHKDQADYYMPGMLAVDPHTVKYSRVYNAMQKLAAHCISDYFRGIGKGYIHYYE